MGPGEDVVMSGPLSCSTVALFVARVQLGRFEPSQEEACSGIIVWAPSASGVRSPSRTVCGTSSSIRFERPLHGARSARIPVSEIWLVELLL